MTVTWVTFYRNIPLLKVQVREHKEANMATFKPWAMFIHNTTRPKIKSGLHFAQAHKILLKSC